MRRAMLDLLMVGIWASFAALAQGEPVHQETRLGPLPETFIGQARVDSDGWNIAGVSSRDGKVHVWFNGVEGPAYDDIAKGHPVLSPTGGRIAADVCLGAWQGGQHFAVIDATTSEPYDALFGPTFLAEGKRVWAIGWHGAKLVPIVDGTAGAEWDQIADPVVTDDGMHLAYAARSGDKWTVTVDGAASFRYEGSEGETMKVKVSAVLPFAVKESSADGFVLEIAPRKTRITVNDSVLEDLTASESVSAMLTTALFSMKNNGQAISVEDVSPGFVSISKLLSLIPAFPEPTMSPGKRWKQGISTLSFPGVPMPDLEFWYLYEGSKDSVATFRLTGDQIIRQNRKQGEATAAITGRSTASGTLSFDTSQGAIEQSSGSIDLNLRIVFSLPPVPGGRASQSLPMTVTLKMTYALRKM